MSYLEICYVATAVLWGVYQFVCLSKNDDNYFWPAVHAIIHVVLCPCGIVLLIFQTVTHNGQSPADVK